MTAVLTVDNIRINYRLTLIEKDIDDLRTLTTQIPGQRMLSTRKNTTSRPKNIRNSVEESSNVANLSDRLLNSIKHAKGELHLDKDEDMSQTIVLIRRYITACENMFRHFHITNSKAFKAIILQCKTIIDDLSTQLTILEELITKRSSGNVPLIEGNAPPYLNKSGGKSRRIHVKPRSRTRKNRCN